MRNVVLMIAVYVAYHSAVCFVSCDTHNAHIHTMVTDHGKRTMKDCVSDARILALYKTRLVNTERRDCGEIIASINGNKKCARRNFVWLIDCSFFKLTGYHHQKSMPIAFCSFSFKNIRQ